MTQNTCSVVKIPTWTSSGSLKEAYESSIAVQKKASFGIEGESMKTEKITLLEFSNWGKATVKQTPGSKERNSKEQDCDIHSQGCE